ncbi:class I histocompatibility antigen, F10 alpha chain-like protein, partial [Lates japonicus]
MKTVIYLVLLGINDAASVIHSLKYFYTGSSHVPNFPEFVSVGSVDEVQMIRYDSNTETAEPKQDWMKRVTEDNPEYLAGEAEHWSRIQQAFKVNIQTAKQRFNQTGETSSDVTVPITAAVVVVALVLFAVSGFVVYKTKKGKSEKSSQQSETSSHSSDNSAKGSDK